MLIQFTVENFRSFRDRSTFSMVGVNGDRQHPEHLTELEYGTSLIGRSQRKKLNFNRYFPEIHETINNNLLQAFAEADSVKMLNLSRKNSLLLRDHTGKLFVLQLKTIHRSEEG
jgi:hypothetical protein